MEVLALNSDGGSGRLDKFERAYQRQVDQGSTHLRSLQAVVTAARRYGEFVVPRRDGSAIWYGRRAGADELGVEPAEAAFWLAMFTALKEGAPRDAVIGAARIGGMPIGRNEIELVTQWGKSRTEKSALLKLTGVVTRAANPSPDEAFKGVGAMLVPTPRASGWPLLRAEIYQALRAGVSRDQVREAVGRRFQSPNHWMSTAQKEMRGVDKGRPVDTSNDSRTSQSLIADIRGPDTDLRVPEL